jgi:hypothetical protein
MKNNNNSIGRLNSSSRTFTFSQLSKISNDNYGVLNRCIDMSSFNPKDVFVLSPIMVHVHAFGVPVNPHLRTSVSKINDTQRLAFQDITYQQWEQGKEINKIAS